MPVDPAALSARTREVKTFIEQNEWLEALEILEELDGKGWAGPELLRDLGLCYVKNRQRRDAELVWIRALEQGYAPVRELLDANCPGWDVRLERSRKNDLTRQAAPEAPPAPPPPPKAATIEVVNRPAPPKAAPAPQAPPARPAAAAAPPAAPAPDESIFEDEPEPEMAAAAPAARQSSGGGSMPNINWNYVMDDVRNEAS